MASSKEIVYRTILSSIRGVEPSCEVVSTGKLAASRLLNSTFGEGKAVGLRERGKLSVNDFIDLAQLEGSVKSCALISAVRCHAFIVKNCGC